MNNLETNNTPAAEQQERDESNGVAMNLFAILGFIAILLAGLWATVQLVRQISNFSFDFNKPSISLFGKSDKLTLIESGKVAVSGATTELQWDLGQDAQESEGAVTTLSYKCQKGLYIKVLTEDTESEEYKVLPCNAPYTMPATVTALPIIPVLTEGEAGELKYVVNYVPKDTNEQEAQSVRGALQITKTGSEQPATEVTQNTAETTTPTVTPSNTTKPAASYTRTVRTVVPVRTSDPGGMPDLTIGVTNVTTNKTTGITTVLIEITNQGTKLVEGWVLSAVLPTEPAYTYTSAPQQALYAGEKAEMLLTFSKTKSGIQDLVITVDPDNAIAESLETNNTVELKLVN